MAHKIYFGVHRHTSKPIKVGNQSVLNLYVYGLREVIYLKWTTVLGWVGQEVWAEVKGVIIFTCNTHNLLSLKLNAVPNILNDPLL